MKRIILLCITGFILLNTSLKGNQVPREKPLLLQTEKNDSLPLVLNKNHGDLIESKLRHEALLRFGEHQLPDNRNDWEVYRVKLKNEIIKKSGVLFNHQLPLNKKETGTIQLKGYTIKNITFQTRPGIYATANLYIPEGNGPFPGVINMVGHWPKGKIDPAGQQAVGHTLALNGYVCLSVDPWGAGERATNHGVFEYHGANLGASLMNIGESLMGIQITDNMRGIDLLCSLNYVDPKNIGATGASGGGNQTMWLAAVDERVKAAVPVVSVGTFESYIMQSNCICELLIDGLTFTEEAGVLALANSIMLCNHLKDAATFLPAQMMRSFNNAQPVFRMMGVTGNISNKIFDLTHGYMAEDREAMLGWFDLHLKEIGTGIPKKEMPYDLLPEEKLMVFPKGQRDANVISTDEYCRKRGNELRSLLLNSKNIDADQKKKELRAILRIDDKSTLKKVHHYSQMDGWDRIALETSDNKLIPILHFPPSNKSQGYTLICHPDGKNSISHTIIEELKKKGSGIVIVDLSGTGEVTSTLSLSFDKIGKLHTLSRAELWLGKTVIGEWVKELNLVAQFLKSEYKANKVDIDGSKEAALAALFLSTLEGNTDNLTLRDAPVSYLFDSRDGIDFFSMGIHLPQFLVWGDISLAAALSGKNISFIHPVSMSGHDIEGEKLRAFETEFEKLRALCHQPGKTTFRPGRDF